MTAGAEGWRTGGICWLARTGVGPVLGAGGDAVVAAPAGCPPSRTPGSEGGGPSRAQRRDSYFDRMKDSILLTSQ